MEPLKAHVAGREEFDRCVAESVGSATRFGGVIGIVRQASLTPQINHDRPQVRVIRLPWIKVPSVDRRLGVDELGIVLWVCIQSK